MIFRVFVEKKNREIYNNKFKEEIFSLLKIKVEDLRIFIRYDADLQSREDLEACKYTVFSEPPVDNLYEGALPPLEGYRVFGVQFLPGQYDQRADSAAQCAQLLLEKDRPLVRCAIIYAIKGVNDDELARIQKFLINPIESQLASLEMPKTLEMEVYPPEPLKTIEGFIKFDDARLASFHKKGGFAMSIEDLKLVRDWFSEQNRDPNEAELKVIDTYWSDHCRHTTFLTEIKSVTINSDNPGLKQAYQTYLDLFQKYNSRRKDKYMCLMDIATIAVKELSAQGYLNNLDASDEINACSIKVDAVIDGKPEQWLVMFKNETHNHPTEIEPYGGAATCLGGAIRDPLSGRVWVYQSMRVTGAADPTVPLEATIKGKLPQRVITKTAAAGFSSYGNQIGLTTGMVSEVYHPDYVAKRMECGFVVGAGPAANVVRKKPEPGDLVVLIGGETGRDGCGGATGSSKAHTEQSIEVCGAEVQKGNPITERKIQRLYRNPEFSTLIKKCNDFGAGGVSVAIGELSDGIDIYLDKVPKKYEGLTITELAISESQERMAIVIDSRDLDKVIKMAAEENLAATHVATVTGLNRMRMFHGDFLAIDIGRDLLNSNGAKQYTDVVVDDGKVTFFEQLDSVAQKALDNGDFMGALKTRLSKLNLASQKGLIEMFDSTIGAATVLMPYGGTRQQTPAFAMAAKLPVTNGNTDTVTVAAYGFNPYLMSQSPFVGAAYSVILSVIKAVAAGASYDSVRLSCQEYFRRLRSKSDWGLPFAALLGALSAQLELKTASIGGKDSMSGSFEDLNVPPTLISFALGISTVDRVTSNVISSEGDIYWIKLRRDGFGMPDYDYVKKMLAVLEKLIASGKVKTVQVVEEEGAAAAAIKSALGNGMGLKFDRADKEMLLPALGDILLMTDDTGALDGLDFVKIATATNDGIISTPKGNMSIDDAQAAFLGTLEKVFPIDSKVQVPVKEVLYTGPVSAVAPKSKFGAPRVFLPVFPGTNCEYDTMRAFQKWGALTNTAIVKNRTVSEIKDSVKMIAREIDKSQIIAFPGGFSGGDEPDGSGKFIASTFQNPYIKEAVEKFLDRGGLIIGICNGFQALVKMGLLPYGKIKPLSADSPTLTYNTINRHISSIVTVKVTSVKSPWLRYAALGGVYAVPISHGEGRFLASVEDLKKMEQNGQIFSQYCAPDGAVRASMPDNPNGSVWAIEGITSPDGKILGKMGHIERCGDDLYKNSHKTDDAGIFRAGVEYFR